MTNQLSLSCIGVSYKKADVVSRGQFSLSLRAQQKLLEAAQDRQIQSITVHSTCNRTEIYAHGTETKELVELLCAFSQGNPKVFSKIGYVLKDEDALNHLFRVGTGLDSQILGDFEIIAQLKKSFIRSKKMGLLDSLFERLFNTVIQASKRIKNETQISSGTTSVSYASVRYILDHIDNPDQKNILLFGMGKIGRNTCENLVKHTQNDHIVLINRTRKRAEKMAGKFKLIVKDYADLPVEIRKADIIIVATGAEKPTLSKSLIHTESPLLILDLSIPKNVDDDVLDLSNVTRIHIDELSRITDNTLADRQKEIPKAKAIIDEVVEEFTDWLGTRSFAPTVQALKQMMEKLEQQALAQHQKKHPHLKSEEATLLSQHLIQKITNRVANHMRNSDNTAESVKTIQDVFNIPSK
ncbi:MAG: glutamyl-tRNA reductase [Flavobacteriaceae bacterium]|nr:glutamyl-tRNA reductase [Flavobacteriaceae bacterium]